MLFLSRPLNSTPNDQLGQLSVKAKIGVRGGVANNSHGLTAAVDQLVISHSQAEQYFQTHA